MHRRTALRCLIVFGLLACSDAPTEPAGQLGWYELVSINERPLPQFVQVPGGHQSFVEAGDLLLRNDGTYSLGADGYITGPFSLNGTVLTLTGLTDRPQSQPARIAGDSVIVHRGVIGETSIIRYFDGVFFRQRRHLDLRLHLASGDSIVGSTETWSHGSVRGSGDSLVVIRQVVPGAEQRRMVLRVEGGSLVRRDASLSLARIERYLKR